MMGKEVMSDQMKMTALKAMMSEKLEEHFDYLGWKNYNRVERGLIRIANKKSDAQEMERV